MTLTERRPEADGRVLVELEPVRRALLADARVEADRRRSVARADAEQSIADARAEVDAAVRHARRKAAASAAARADAALAAARREAHSAVLAAHAELQDELLERVRSTLVSVPDDPRYPRLRDHLIALARAQLGDDVRITDDPAGGIVGSLGGRRVDYRLAVLAERALDAAGEEVTRL